MGDRAGAGPAADWIAVDWGTSRVRAWAMGADGRPRAAAASAEGMGALAPPDYPAALARLAGGWRRRGGPTPVVVCGMAGAREGWAPAPYAAVGAPLATLADAAAAVAAGDFAVRILPGLAQAEPPDVMRGEETQIAGLLAREPGFEGLVALPGTHAKWARVAGGAIVAFRTMMTGELFALLAGRSVLRHGVAADPAADDPAAFADAVREAAARPAEVPALLFGVRAAGLLAGLSPAAARARLSGLLIGAEIAAAAALFAGSGEVVVLGAAALAARYAAALAVLERPCRIADAEAATLAGLAAARARLSD